MRILFPIVFFSLLGSSTGFAAEKNLVAPLNDQSAIDGCSWSASSERMGKSYIFLAEYDLSRILMNIDGIDVDLELSSRSGSIHQLGSVSRMVYQAKGIIVRSTYKTTWVCPKDDSSESCEVTRFNATYEVSKGARHQVVYASGDVGC